ncbi:MAG: YdcF family protein [Deltaproteobacteria bacterium]|nr:MAG: YdcF family protein [Deltaproteobacteria bacterium]
MSRGAAPGWAFDGVLVLGKELRRDPVRAWRELRARCAAASAALRAGSRGVACLEAPFRGQERSGSDLVAGFLAELGVEPSRIHLRSITHSTRAEAVDGAALADRLGWRRLLVLTHAYHVDRARRYFEEERGAPGVAVHDPGALLRLADARERAWILAGAVTGATRRAEQPTERLFGLLGTALRPLPRPVRHGLERRAGRWLRAVGEPGSAGRRRRAGHRAATHEDIAAPGRTDAGDPRRP